MNLAREIEHSATPSEPHDGTSLEARRFLFRESVYRLSPLSPKDPERIARAEGALEYARPYDPSCWVLGLSAAPENEPEDIQAFYAVGHSGVPERLDNTLAFVCPGARGRHLSHLVIYGVYLELLRLPGFFVLCESIDHPRLRLHARCGFAPPVRKLRNGKVEIGRFEFHTVLSRIEAEDGIRELPDDRAT